MLNQSEFFLKQMTENDLDFDFYIWGMQLKDYFAKYLNYEFYLPLIYKKNNTTCGVSQMIHNQKVAWLGLIFVHEEFRNHGLGSLMTQKLIDIGLESNVQTFLLFATEMGESIYQKLGFEYEELYVYAKPPEHFPDFICPEVKPFTPDRTADLFSLDQQITGEDRSKYLSLYLHNAIICQSYGQIVGYYLPSLGTGIINAISEDAAIQLMQYKINQHQPYFIFPQSNHLAYDFLKSLDYNFDSKIPRMYYGKKPNTLFQYMFNRGTGYSG